MEKIKIHYNTRGIPSLILELEEKTNELIEKANELEKRLEKLEIDLEK